MATLILLLLSSSAFLILRSLLYHIRRQREFGHLGCMPAVEVPSNDKLGLSKVYGHLRARRESRWPSFLAEVLDSAGENVHTASHWAISHRMFYTRDSENAKAILTAPKGDYVLGHARSSNFSPVLGNGLFTAEGSRWQHYRASARPMFTRTSQESHLNAMEQLLQRMWTSFPIDHNGWTCKMDLQKVFLDLMLAATVDLLFSDPGHTDKAASQYHNHSVKPDINTLSASLDAASTFIGNRTVMGKLFWLKQSRDFRHHCQVIRQYIDGHFDAARRDKYGPGKDERIWIIRKVSSTQQDLAEFRSQIQPFLSTGRYPMGALLAVTFFYLMKDPPLLHRLRNELISKFGVTGKINFSELKSCEYLNFCVLEGLRLGSVVPAMIRSATKDMILPRGGGRDRQSPISVPRGSSLIICIQALHLRTDLWGDDAESFNPDRWRTPRSSWNFLPFSKGPRQCIGRE